MIHGGDVYSDQIEYDFSVSLNPNDSTGLVDSILNESRLCIGNYPDINQKAFKESIAAAEGIKADEVIGTNGASEAIHALLSMLKPSRIMLVNPCFTGYRQVLSQFTQTIIVNYYLLEEENYLPGEHFLNELTKEASRGLEALILTNPNNPTGRNIPKDILDRILEICIHSDIAIIVDECFIRMSDKGHSMKEKINSYHKLYIINAYTKLFSIPGVRLGYILTNSKNINRISSFLPEWNLSVIAQSAGCICSDCLINSDWESKTKELIRIERDYLTSELKQLGFKVFESDTVFILFYSPIDIFDYLKDKSILIRDCSEIIGLKKGFYRIAVKKHSDNEILINALKDYMR